MSASNNISVASRIHTCSIAYNISMLILNNPSPEQIEIACKENVPVLIRGLLPQWQDVIEWTPDFFSRNYGEVMVSVNIKQVEQQTNTLKRVKLNEYIDWMKKIEDGGLSLKRGENYYLAESLDFLEKADLEDEIDQYFHKICPAHVQKLASSLITYTFWMGPKGSRTGFHYDIDYRNFLCLISGQKEFVLVSPQYTKDMYPSDRYEYGSRLSQIDIWEPVDAAKFPRFIHDVKYLRFTLQQGEILFVPAYWWHAVKNLTTTVAVGLRYETAGSILNKTPDYLKHWLHRHNLYGSHENCVCHAKTVS